MFIAAASAASLLVIESAPFSLAQVPPAITAEQYREQIGQELAALRSAAVSNVRWLSTTHREIEEKKLVAKQAAERATKKRVLAIKNGGTRVALAPAKPGSHVFYAGQCTSYVASRATITWGGNAGQWLGNAAAQGYETSKQPELGSIVVTSESGAGHVAIVEEIKGDVMVVSEMNYVGVGKLTKREIPLNYGKIKGYITDDRVKS